MFKAPAGEGEPWKRVLRRANSEAEARKIFAQAEAALDTEQAAPASADCARDPHDRSARRGVHRGQQAARQGTTHDPGTRVPAERPHHPRHRQRTGREVAGRAQPQSDGARIEDDPLRPRTRGPARSDGCDAQARLAPRLAGPEHRPAGWPGDRPLHRPARRDDPLRRPSAAPRDPAGEGDGRRPPTRSAAPTAPTRC